LRLVPIRRLQPKPHTASDYCYSGRLLSFRRSGFPATPGLPVIPVTAPPSGCPFFPALRRDFRDEVSFRHMMSSPLRESPSFSVPFGAEALCSLKPCDSISERTFPVFFDLLNTRGQVRFVQPSALLMRSPEGLTEPEVFHLSNPYRFHIFQAALYRSPDISKVKLDSDITIEKHSML
jgi:hypothetical protein